MRREVNYIWLILQYCLGVMMCIFPIMVNVVQNHIEISYVVTSVVMALPLVALMRVLKPKWLSIVLFTIVLLMELVEIFMVVKYHGYTEVGNILSIWNTDVKEARSLLANSIDILPYFVGVLLIYALLVVSIIKGEGNNDLKWHLMIFGAAIIALIVFVTVKREVAYDKNITYRYFVKNRILNRPPYNTFYQIANATRISRMERYIEEAKEFRFGATRIDDVNGKEVYVLAIGESMNYSHLSANGKYKRETTPNIEREQNLILFDDYCSTGCLTLLSVPQILTRATAKDYELCYKELSIVEPYRECGFHTFAIVCHNLLMEKHYLTEGVEELICVENDIDIPRKIDSLANQYEKLMIVAELLGSHFSYYNYSEEYDRYKPNINEKEAAENDSLYINAYDNSILYTDHVLGTLFDNLRKQNAVSAVMYTSDHGEGVAKDGGGHGGNCNPSEDEYHVPLIVWYSDGYKELNQDKIDNLQRNKSKKISGDNVFYSMCDMANISLKEEYEKKDWSVFSERIDEHMRYVLLPDWVSVKCVE